VYAVPRDGIHARVVRRDGPRSFAADNTSVYAVAGNGAGTTLYRIDKTGSAQAPGAAAALATLVPGAIAIAVDNLGVIVANAGTGTIVRVPRDGGPAATLADDVAGVSSVAADAQGVYWTSDSGAVTWLHR